MPIPRLRIDQTALLIIDVQEGLLPTIIDGSRIVNNSTVLVTMAEELRMPYLVTEQYPTGLGRTAQPITSAMTDQSLRIEKTSFSAATVDLVEEHMHGWRRDTMLIAGLEAHVCVLQTVLDFQSQGRQCFVCTDAVSAGQREQIDPALDRMRQAGAVLTGVIGAMYELLGDARHPSFRNCLRLAKAIEW